MLELADKIWETYKDNNVSSVNQVKSTNLYPEQYLNQNIIKHFEDISLRCRETLDSISQKNQALEFQVNSLQLQINALQSGRFSSRQINRPSRVHNRMRSSSLGSSLSGSMVPIFVYELF